MKHLVSIIVPVYNIDRYLRRCLDSILRQTFGGFEVLLVDDGSTDASGEICDDFAARDSRFRVFHQANGGVSSARNLGLENARGDYVWFVDGDDAIKEGALEVLERRLASHPGVDMVLFGAETVAPGATVRRPVAHAGRSVAMHDCHDAASFRTLYGSYIVSAWNACYRRDTIDATRFRPYRIGEDVLFSMEMLYRVSQVAVTEDVLYTYYHREGSAIHQLSLDHFRDHLGYCTAVVRLQSQRQEWIRDLLERRYWNKLAGESLFWLNQMDGVLRKEAFEEWLVALTDVRRRNVFRNKYKLILSVSLAMPWYFVAHLFLGLPFRFKRLMLMIRNRKTA